MSFDDTNYEITQTATLTISDPILKVNNTVIDFLPANIVSKTDLIGIDIMLAETNVDTGTFTATFNFTGSASSGATLQVKPGDNLSAIFNGNESKAAILPNIEVLSFRDLPESEFNVKDVAFIRVEDSGANKNPEKSETVSVSVNSTVSTKDTRLTLHETGDDTGIFKNARLLFMIGSSPNLSSSSVTGTVSLINENDDIGNTLPLTVRSTSNSTGITLDLIRVDTSTTFSNSLTLGDVTIQNSAIEVSPGDILQLDDEVLSTNWLIEPNSDDSLGAIQVLFTGRTDSIGDIDNVTSSYVGASVLNDEIVSQSVVVGTKVIPGTPGGFGGGLGPSTIIVLLNSIGSTISIPPIIDITKLSQYAPFAVPAAIKDLIDNIDKTSQQSLAPDCIESIDFPYTFSINDNACFYIAGYSNTLQTTSLETEKLHTMNMTFYDVYDIQNAVIQFYPDKIAIQGGRIVDSDTQIIYQKDKPIEIKDPFGIFSNNHEIQFTVLEDGSKKTLNLQFAFVKSIDNLDVVSTVSNTNRAPQTNIFHDSIRVVESTEKKIEQVNIDETIKEPIDTNLSDILSEPVPSALGDELTSLRNTILNWAGYSENKISDSELLEYLEFANTDFSIPHWFKQNMSKFFYKDLITEEEFKTTLSYISEKELEMVK